MVKRAESSALLCTFASSPLREDIMAVAGYRGGTCGAEICSAGGQQSSAQNVAASNSHRSPTYGHKRARSRAAHA